MNIAKILAGWILPAALAFIAPLAQAATPTPARAQAGEEVFYHLFLRSFRDADGDRIGDLKGLTEKLDYLRDLGVTSLLLTPLQPSPFYHNYFATDFETIEPKYGTMDDYFAFVRAAHVRGLKVYLDQEIQYVAEGHPWWTQSLGKPQAEFADYLLWRDPQHNEAEPFLNQARWEGYDGRWIGIAMVDMNRPAVKRYFEKTLLFWADPHGDGSGRDGVDGFRIDHMMDDLDNKGLAKNLFAGFWTPIFKALKARRPGFRIIAEQSDWGYGQDWLARGNADLVFAFPLRGALTKLDKREIVEALRKTAEITPAGKGQIVFLENHDTDRFMSLIGGDSARARAGAALALLLKGEPLLYYGQELGMRGVTRKGTMSDSAHIPLREAMRWNADLDAPGSAIWYKSDKPWWNQRYNRSGDGVSVQEEGQAGSLHAWYRQLLALRRTRPELRNGTQRIVCGDDSPVICVLRESGAARSLLLVNLGTTTAKPDLDATLAGATWTDLLDGGMVDAAQLRLQPLAVRVLGTP
ncbi:alpha-amylase family glycosyl hydrolase [Luteimonas sp. SX5]|uniref:Alpha-amylase family glycosyl hydrolase n=1 Tax=Luteimonas galliterrae TaxID=2940486 RepID=A0ABT0MLF4_9GAMM|nr:alpha-amylase family glycosyl hydrolase [Luteimonas galliterrae]MCL1635718.1 alpha-amylase family glycosyl hydrolase [Luteimonas galliterrae]